MIRSIILFIVLLAGRMSLSAQPVVSYLIPDIGAPGMNTYVEIIAPYDAYYSFGDVDDLLPKRSVAVRTVYPKDSLRVVISPCVVSWKGRLISCQFFVDPSATPGPVPIEVVVDGQISNVDTFFIVRPQHLGRIAGGGAIGSGDLGTRSKRGAMIVDSLVLEAGAFTVNTEDTDPMTPGNQGYLPFILIAQGPILMIPTTTISVSATNKNGGPGGGGGGGYGETYPGSPPLIPSVPGEIDLPLGEGYSGGRSSVPVVPSPGGFGIGSGSDSRSLNGAGPGASFSPTRLFGAGVAHPFDVDGRSGGAAAVGIPPATFGLYYGGGGNATPGSGVPQAPDVNGQTIGNDPIVPFFGGAGGSSGGAGDRVGGGGGGAIALYSNTRLYASTIRAHGANGHNGEQCGMPTDGCGDASAGGAGGGIALGGRTGVGAAVVDLAGGNAGEKSASAIPGSTSGSGGNGRFRYDGPLERIPTTTSDASQFSGISMDTLSYSESRTVTVSGTAADGDSILVYVSNGRSWDIDAPYVTTSSGGVWQVDVTLPYSPLVYVYALRKSRQKELDAATEFTSMPRYTFSQVAATIIRFAAESGMEVPTSVAISPITCGATTVTDTIPVVNTGSAPLELRSSSLFKGPEASRFTIISPTLPATIDPGDTVLLIVRFDGTGMPDGTFRDELELHSNDPGGPRTIELSGAVEAREFTLRWPFIDIGDVDVGSRRDTAIVYINRNSFRDSILAVISESDTTIISMYRVEIRGDTTIMWIKFTPHDVGPFSAKYKLRISPCDIDTTVTITGYGRRVIVDADSTWTIGIPACSDTALARFVVRNRSNRPLYLRSPVFSGPGAAQIATISPPARDFPIVVAAGDSTWLTLRAIRSSAGSIDADVLLQDDRNPSFSFQGRVRESSEGTVRLESPRRVDFGAGCVGSDSRVFVPLRNIGSATGIQITAIEAVGDDSPFSGDLPSTIVDAADSVSLLLLFRPATVGTFSDTLLIHYTPCDRVDSIVVEGQGVDGGLRISATAIDFGEIGIPTKTRRTVTIGNAAQPGSPDIVVGAIEIVPPRQDLTIVSPTAPPQYRIAPGQSLDIVVEFTPVDTDPLSETWLNATISGPCSAYVSLPITGRGVEPLLSPSVGSVDLGAATHCERPLDSVVIRNFIPASVKILGISIEPTGATDGFGWQTATALPLTLPSGDSIVVGVYLTDVGQTDGPLSASLVLSTDATIMPRLEIPLHATRVSESLRLGGPVFNPVRTGQRQQLVRSLINDGTAPTTITRIELPPPFAVLSTTPPLPVRLLPADTLTVVVEFAPPDSGAYHETMVVYGPFRCDTATLFAFHARGIDEETVTGRWESIQGEPGEIVRIPLRIDGSPSGASVTEYSVGLRYDPTMLKPLGISLDGTLSRGWTVASTTIGADSVVFDAAGTTPIAGQGILAYIRAQVLLGEATQSELAPLHGMTAFGPTALLNIAPGTFTLTGYCRVGDSPRLLRVRSGFGIKSVTPTPASNLTEVEIEAVENGPTRVTLYDALGRRVAVLLDATVAPGAYRIPADLTSLSDGLYYIVLQTPTDHDRARVVIAR